MKSTRIFLHVSRKQKKTVGKSRKSALAGSIALFAASALTLFSPSANAATFYWDADATAAGNNTDGTGLGGTGTWDTGTPNWWDGVASDVVWGNTFADVAIFSGPYPASGIPTASNVTVSGNVNANQLRFRRSGYVLTGGTITLGGTTPTLAARYGESATINSQILGSDGLTKTGGGSIRLAAGNAYTGTTTISGGTLIITNQSALGADSSTVTVSGSATRGFGAGSLFLDGSAGAINFTRNLSLQGLGPIADRGASVVSFGNNTISGNISNAGVTNINTRLVSAYGTLTLAGGVDVAGAGGTTVTLLGGVNQADSPSYVITGPITGTGTLEKTGSGVLTLTPSATTGFSGTVRISSSATGQQSSVRILSTGVIGSRTNTTTGSVLDLNGGILEVLMDAPLVQTTGATNANVYGRTSGTIFVDHAPGSSVTGGTLTLGAMAYEDNATHTFTSRNGYGITIGATPVQGGDNNSNFTNNVSGGGTLTFNNNFWSNTENTGSRNMTIAGNGNTTITGNIVATGGSSFDHNIIKSGTGTLQITSTGATLDGNLAIQGGTVQITDFRSLNMHAASTTNTGQINLGTTTVAGTLNIGTATAATAAGLTMSPNVPLNLNTTTGTGTINANQTQAFPVLISNVTNTGAGTKTLVLGGTSTQLNNISGVITNHTAAGNTTSVTKTDAGTWVLSGSNTYTGNTTVSGGTLRLAPVTAVAGVSNVVQNSSPVIFTSNATTLAAGGTLEFSGISGTATTEALGALTPTFGAGTVSLIGNGGTAANLTFSGLGAIGRGTGINFVTTAGNGGTVTITGTGTSTATTLPGNGHFYINGANFARANADVMVTPVYGTDTGFSAPNTVTAATHVLVNTNIASQATVQVSSLKLDNASIAMATATTVLTVRTGAAGTDGGILATGTSAISQGQITSGQAGAIVIRVNQAADTLTLGANLVGTTTGGLTKNGAGTLIIGGLNTHSGTTSINEGTVRLTGSGRLSGSGQGLDLRQGATLNVNGLSTSIAIGAFNGAGTVTNSNAAPGTLLIGNVTTGAGTFTGILQNGTGVLNVSVTGTTGTHTLSGLNTYTGATTIGTGLATTAKLIAANTIANIGSNSSIGRGDSTSPLTNAASLVFGGLSSAGISYTGTTVGSTDRLFTFNGNFAGAGGQIAANGVNNAPLLFTNTAPVSFGAGLTVGQTLILSGASLADNRINLQLTDNGTNVTSVTKNGVSVWVLGNTANTYSGTTTVTDGILIGDSGTSLPTASGLVIGAAGATTVLFQTTGTFERNVSATPGANTVTFASATGAAGFAAATPDKLIVALGGVATPTALTWGAGGFAPSGTSLLFGSTTALGEVEFRNAIDLAGAVRTINVLENVNTGGDFATITGIISGTGGLVKGGNGPLVLTGANSYIGTTAVNGSSLTVFSLGDSSVVGSSSVGDTTNANTDAGAITLGTGGTGASLQYVGAGETSNRKIRFNGSTGGAQIHADGTGPLILTNVANDLTAGAKTLNLRGTNTAGNIISSVLNDNGGALSVQVDGGAVWILSGANGYTGNTTVSGGALGIGDNAALGTSTIVLNNGNTFAYGADRTVTNVVQLQNNVNGHGFIGDYSLAFTQPLTNQSSANGTTIANNIATGKSLTFGGITFNSITANRSFTVDGTGETFINGDLTTTQTTNRGVNIVKNNTGTLILGGTGSNANNFNRNNQAIDIDNGTVRLAQNEVIGDGLDTQTVPVAYGGLTLSPELATLDVATFDLNGRTETINALTATTDGTAVINNSAATQATLAFGGANAVSSFGTGAGTYSITNTGGGALNLTKIGSGLATFGAGMTTSYTGVTRVEGGTLTIGSNLTGTTALQVANTGSTLALVGGVNGATVTSINVADGATLNLLDGAGNKLTNLSSLTLGSPGGTNTTLVFNVGDGVTAGDQLNTDLLQLVAGGVLTLNAGNNITFNLTDIGLNANQTYVLLDATNIPGGFTSGPLTASNYVLGSAIGGFTSATIGANDNQVFLTTGNLITGALYFAGLTDNTWNGNVNNWSTDKAGTVPAASIPGSGTDVVFRADNAVTPALTTTLEANFKINSLTFEASTTPANTPATITVAPGAAATNRLEVAPQLATDGVKITAGGTPAVTISAPFRLGADQTWSVADAASVLTFSGGLQGEKNVNITGAGKITLSAAANSLTFNTGQTSVFTVTSGTLETTVTNALGSVADANRATIALAGGAFYYNNGTAGTVANPMTFGGGVLSAGGNAQTYSGNINVTAPTTVNLRDQNSGIANTQSRAITLSGIITGAGKLTLDSVATVTTGNQFTGNLTLSNNANNFTGDIAINRGTVIVTSTAGYNGNLSFDAFGRVIFRNTNGMTFNRTGTTTYAAGAVAEYQADNTSGVLGADYVVNQQGQLNLNAGSIVRFFLADVASSISVTGGVVLNGTASVGVAGGDADSIVTISGTGISGTGDLNINDEAGAWTQTSTRLAINAAGTFVGNTTLNEGFLILGNKDALSTGSLTITGASSLQAGVDLTATGAGPIATPVVANAALTLSGTNNFTLSTAISGSSGIVKAGANTVNLGAANTYLGSTSVDEGTLLPLVSQNMAGALNFGSTNAITTAGTLDLTNVNGTFGSMLVQTNSGANTSSVLVGPAQTLTINGNVTIGSNGANSTTLFSATGGGAMVVTNAAANGVFAVGGNVATGNQAQADLSGLSSLSISLDPATGIVRVNPNNGTNVGNKFSVLTLPSTGAGTTTVTANILAVGDGGQNGSVGAINQLKLGTGVNTLNVNTVNIGTGARDIGSLTFNGGTGSVILRDAAGTGRAAFNVATSTANTGVTASTGNLIDLTGHSADLLISTLAIGGQNRNVDRVDTFSFDTGTLDATTVVVGDTNGAGNASVANNTWTSNLNLSGGTTTIGAGGIDIGRSDSAVTGTDIVNGNVNLSGNAVVTVANNAGFGAAIRLGDNTIATNVTANGNLSITGTSSLTVAGDIIKGASTGASTGTVTLNGGTLNMSGNSIGSGAASVTFNAQSGTVSNVAGVNGAAGTLVKSTAGTLNVTGTNPYTAATQIDAGTLNVSGTLSGTSGVTVNNTGTLLLSTSNVINDTAGVTLNGGTFRTAGASEGTGTSVGLGALTLSANSILNFGLGGVATLNFNGIGAHNPGATALTIDNWTGTLNQAGVDGTDDRLVFAGNASDFSNAFAQNDIMFSGIGGGYSAIQFDAGHYEIVAVPEPATTALIGSVALCALIGYRERRRFTGKRLARK